jgi:hypothetical protein
MTVEHKIQLAMAQGDFGAWVGSTPCHAVLVVRRHEIVL